MQVLPADVDDPQVIALLSHHVRTARAATAPGSAHALDIAALKAPEVQLWAVWHEDQLLGVGALKRLAPGHGEVKSMHTASGVRRRGVGTLMLSHIVAEARRSGITRLSLETGSWDYFEPARAFYRRHGFRHCGPFADYCADPHSVFMTLELPAAGRR